MFLISFIQFFFWLSHFILIFFFHFLCFFNFSHTIPISTVMDSIGQEPEVKIVVMSENNCELKPSNIDRNRLSIPNNDLIPTDISNNLSTLKSERSRSLDPTQAALDGFDANRRRVSSISSLGNWTGAVIVSEASEPIRNQNGKWYFRIKASLFYH